MDAMEIVLADAINIAGAIEDLREEIKSHQQDLNETFEEMLPAVIDFIRFNRLELTEEQYRTYPDSGYSFVEPGSSGKVNTIVREGETVTIDWVCYRSQSRGFGSPMVTVMPVAWFENQNVAKQVLRQAYFENRETAVNEKYRRAEAKKARRAAVVAARNV